MCHKTRQCVLQFVRTPDVESSWKKAVKCLPQRDVRQTVQRIRALERASQRATRLGSSLQGRKKIATECGAAVRREGAFSYKITKAPSGIGRIT